MTSPSGCPTIAARPLHRMLPVTAALLVRNADLVEMGRSRVNDLSLLFTRLYSFGSTASPAVADFTHRMLGETSIDVVAEFLPTLQRHQRQAALHTLAVVPSLVMVGQGDRMTPAEHSLDMARRLPRSELEIMADSGHMMILEHYPQVNHQLRRLVARVREELAAEAAGDAGRSRRRRGRGQPPVTGWHRDGQAWCATARDADDMRALGADLVAHLAAGRRPGPRWPARRREDHVHPGHRRGDVGARVGHQPDVRDRPEPPGTRAPALVHVDAYRLHGSVEVEDLDLDADLERAVTVVEWGAGKVEGLAADRLEVLIRREVGSPVDPEDPSGGVRTVLVRGVGPRWAGLRLDRA